MFQMYCGGIVDIVLYIKMDVFGFSVGEFHSVTVLHFLYKNGCKETNNFFDVSKVENKKHENMGLDNFLKY